MLTKELDQQKAKGGAEADASKLEEELAKAAKEKAAEMQEEDDNTSAWQRWKEWVKSRYKRMTARTSDTAERRAQKRHMQQSLFCTALFDVALPSPVV